MNKRINKIAFISILAAILTVPLMSCNNTQKSEENPTPRKFTTASNIVKVTFDAGDGYVDENYTIHSKQVDIHKGLFWKYIQNRIPTTYFYNHTFNWWTIHGEKVEDTYQLNSDVTVTANYTAGKITTLRLNAGTEGTFDAGATTHDVGEFTANTTYGALKEAGAVVEPTPTSEDKIFAGYKDPKGNYIEDVTRINFKQPELEGAKYVFTATYVDKPTKFEDDEWSTLVAASNRGLAYLKTAYDVETFIGKEKQLELNDGQTYTLRVIGEEEDTTTNNTKAALTFEFENVLIPNQAYDTYSHNNNTYSGSSLDKALNKLLDNFPASLKGTEGIKSVYKITNGGNKGGATSAATTPHILFPLSATEMNITSVGEAMANASAYSYYSSTERTTSDYIRTYIDPLSGEEYNSDYWLRSPDYQSNIACNCMGSTGEVIGNPIDINIGKGVVPAFCIGTSSEKISVTFDVNTEGGLWKGGSKDNITKEITSGGLLSSATSSLPTFSKDSSTFAGWYTYDASSKLDQLISDTDHIYTTVTLHAHFIADDKLATVEFNGGTQYVSSGATRTLLNNDYVTTISTSAANSYHQAPTSTRGIEVTVTADGVEKAITNFTVDSTGKLTIPAKYVYGNIKINILYGTIAYNKEEAIASIAAEDEKGSTPGAIAKQYFSIGDILNVGVKEGDSDVNYRAMIIGMGHSTDTFDGGTSTAAFTFEFLDMPGEIEIAYSATSTLKPSYADSLVKSAVDSYYEKITNATLKGAIKNVTHTTTKDYSASSYDSFTSYMFTLSAAEHTSIEEAQAPELEGKQYEYYSTYNDHTKYRNGAPTTYWLRTSYVSDSGYNRAYYVYASGDYYNYTTYHTSNYKGVAPAFCL